MKAQDGWGTGQGLAEKSGEREGEEEKDLRWV